MTTAAVMSKEREVVDGGCEPDVGSFPSRSIRPTVANVAVVAVLATLYLVFIKAFARNGIFWDDWTLVPIVDSTIHHHWDWSQLWQQHNENRELIPFALMALIGSVTHLSTLVIVYVSAIMFIGTFVLLLGCYGQYSGRPVSPWSTLFLGVLWFSIVDTENALWAFQIAWYIVLLCAIAMLYVLGRQELTGWKIAFAVVIAIIASFSSLQGLLLWPIGLFVICWRVRGVRRLLTSAVVWVVASAVSVVVYFHRFDFSTSATGGGSTSYAFHHLSETSLFVLALVGNVFPTTQPDLGLHQALGAALLFVAIVIVSASTYARRSSTALPLPAALMMFAVLFDLTVAAGRVSFGMLDAVVSSRYCMANLLIMLALAIAIFVGPSVVPAHRRRSLLSLAGVATCAVALVISAQAVIATDVGLKAAKEWNRHIEDGDTVLVKLDRIAEPARSALFNAYVFPSLQVATEAKWVAMVQRDRLGELAPGTAASYRRVPTPPPLP